MADFELPESDDVPVVTGMNAMPEPETDDALSAFNKAWNAKLEAQRAKEAEAEKQVRLQAEQDLSSWNAQREAKLSAKKNANRQEEQVKVETLESEVDGANPWDRVTKLIDANQDAATDSKKADTTRMRKLFIQLKNGP